MMTLVRWQPSRFGNIHREIDRFFHNSWFRRSEQSSSPEWRPATDVVESEDAWTLTMDLPGVSREAIKVGIEQDTLTIEGERARGDSEHIGDDRWAERLCGGFRRRFTLPEGTNAEGITAECRDGVLTVTLPKAEPSKPREITVEVG